MFCRILGVRYNLLELMLRVEGAPFLGGSRAV